MRKYNRDMDISRLGVQRRGRWGYEEDVWGQERDRESKEERGEGEADSNHPTERGGEGKRKQIGRR